MRRSPLVQSCPYCRPGDKHHAQRTTVGNWKKSKRAELRSLGVTPRFIASSIAGSQASYVAGSQGDALVREGRAAEDAMRARETPTRGASTRAPAESPATSKPELHDPTCVTTFNANTKVTKIEASAVIDRPVDELTKAIDPRGWGLSNGVIDVAFRVARDSEGIYSPKKGDVSVALGKPWKDGLLFEYARSEVASFENILAIETFEVTPGRKLYVRYRLVDCLKTIIGFWSVDGGLQRNDGFVSVERDGRRGSIIKVEKNIRVRDMTPNDPGNRYDFGQALNSTLGAALSAWVDDVSMMSPIF